MADEEDDGGPWRLATTQALTVYYDRPADDPYELLGITVYRHLHRRATERAVRRALALERFFQALMARREGVQQQLLEAAKEPEPAPLAIVPVECCQADDCSICMSPSTGGRGDDPPCRHAFHCHCLDEWVALPVAPVRTPV